MHLALPTAKSKRGRKIATWIGLGLLALTVILGAWGLSGPLAKDAARSCLNPHYSVVDRIYRFFLLMGFGGEGLSIRNCFASPALEVARFTGPAGVFAGFLALVWGWLEEAHAWWRLATQKQHTVVVGLGRRGRALSDAAGRRVVGVDVTAMDAVLPRGCSYVVGDGCDGDILDKAKVQDASATYAATGDDILNLKIAQRAASKSGSGDVYALVSDAFARRVSEQPMLGAINAISLEELAARALLEEARFHELAELQGHGRVHLVVFGDGPLAGAIIAQTVRIALTSRLGPPAVTVLSASPEQARRSLLRNYPGLARACDLQTLEFDPPSGDLDQPAFYAAVASRAPVSAIVVVDPEPQRAWLFAGALQGALRRAQAWPAPIFFSAAPVSGVEDLSSPLGGTRRLADVLHPFETGASLCTPANLARLDQAAKALHEAYRDAHAELSRTGGSPSAAAESLKPWAELAPTYRQANRRAADHVPAKLLSAGCHVPHGAVHVAPGVDLLAGGRLERLAELEHRAWMADRLLAGWRPGATRNDRARIHDCLVPYDELREATRELDRAQVRDLVDNRLKPSGDAGEGEPLVRLDLWLGVIGALDVEDREIGWLQETAVAQLEAEMARTPGRHLTLVTPLAPGADLIVTRALLACAGKHRWPHRLIVPQALDETLLVADFEDRWRAGAAGDVTPYGVTWPEVASGLMAARKAVVAAAPDACIVEATVEGENTRAYRWQAGYMVRTCDILLAAVRSRSGRAAGGAAETLRWRADPSLIPAPFATAPARLMEAPPRTIVLNLRTRQVE